MSRRHLVFGAEPITGLENAPLKKRCHDSRRSGHKRGLCKSSLEKKKRNSKQKRKPANNVTLAPSLADVAVNSINCRVQIDGKTARMRLDTGADVTLLSTADWTAMGRPKLQSLPLTLKSANNEPINARGCYECNFIIDGHRRYGTCHVADTPSLLSLDWIAQHEPQFRHLTEGSICNISSRTLITLKSSLATHLKKKFPAVFAPGLGCCTKSKAKLALKPDSKPVLLKAHPPPPSAAVTTISTEINQLVPIHVLEPVDNSARAAPIVVVQKKKMDRSASAHTQPD
ncbi:hypothetical protein RB195_023130 [Necator americanus]|uniref:Peptidase A2 domain-containing protein n=1 Tax=Necator americanus TaxID=51031 RepID=A0ABR1EHY0_NECAM